MIHTIAALIITVLAVLYFFLRRSIYSTTVVRYEDGNNAYVEVIENEQVVCSYTID